ncbi:hypothetical protein [Tsukamurella sp. USMM236]|uniref:hypothetical protein n=1 Tax=Tsukamurella sp. USMM236 TaxID=3081301 RepID=UPI0030195A42
MTYNIRRRHHDILAVDDGVRAWTATVDPDRTIRRIANATSNRPIKLDGPLGKRITAAVHDWLVECANRLPTALEIYTRALVAPEYDGQREEAWHRCLQLGATHDDYIRARRRAERIAS